MVMAVILSLMIVPQRQLSEHAVGIDARRAERPRDHRHVVIDHPQICPFKTSRRTGRVRIDCLTKLHLVPRRGGAGDQLLNRLGVHARFHKDGRQFALNDESRQFLDVLDPRLAGGAVAFVDIRSRRPRDAG